MGVGGPNEFESEVWKKPTDFLLNSTIISYFDNILGAGGVEQFWVETSPPLDETMALVISMVII